MKEQHRKGGAIHPDPESCVGGREAAGEALTGERAGWVKARWQTADAMMRARCFMATREELRRMLDRLPESQLPVLQEYFDDLRDSDDEVLSPQTESAVREGLDDIRGGRGVSLEEYRRGRGL